MVSEPRERLGCEYYPGLEDWVASPEDMMLCATWSSHVDFIVCTENPDTHAVALGPEAVKKLVSQLRIWLAKLHQAENPPGSMQGDAGPIDITNFKGRGDGP